MILSDVQGPGKNPPLDQRVVSVSKDLEAAFIAEMLKTIEPKDASTFGGGAGEDQFRSFLLEHRAKALVAAGGLGLAKHFAAALEEKND